MQGAGGAEVANILKQWDALTYGIRSRLRTMGAIEWLVGGDSSEMSALIRKPADRPSG